MGRRSNFAGPIFVTLVLIVSLKPYCFFHKKSGKSRKKQNFDLNKAN